MKTHPDLPTATRTLLNRLMELQVQGVEIKGNPVDVIGKETVLDFWVASLHIMNNKRTRKLRREFEAGEAVLHELVPKMNQDMLRLFYSLMTYCQDRIDPMLFPEASA